MRLTVSPPDESARFWNRVQTGEGCWLWQGARQRTGYGTFTRAKWRGHPRTCLAHRWAWVQANGEIPDGLWVLHRCDNRKCVRPDHLFLGTHKDNMRDMVLKGRSPRHPGEANHHAKLTAPIVLEILHRHAGGETQTALAMEYGIDQTTVSKLVLGQAWKHVNRRSAA